MSKSQPDMVGVEAQVPAWMLDAAEDTFPNDTTSELICRGLAILARMGPHMVKIVRREREGTP